MYIPDHFRTPDSDIDALLAKARTGTLVTVEPDTVRPLATFLPWVVAGRDRLTSHVGSINPQAGHHGQALVIVMGADAYVSDEWMSPGAAPSWDYETLHIYGDLVTHTDPDWIIGSWDEMLRRFSHRTVADYDHDWLVRMAQAVTGVEVRITDIEAKSKLSQNRSEAEVRVIADQVEPACPYLADRIRQVAIPHAADRDEKVRNAVPYQLD